MPRKKTAEEAVKTYESSGSIAFDRDRFAADRTIMAWIRTSLSLIGFGFSIFKFFEFLGEVSLLQGTHISSIGPKKFGIALVVMGVFFLFLATIEYVFFIRRLCRKVNQKFIFSASLLASVILSIIGLAVLISMLFKGINLF